MIPSPTRPDGIDESAEVTGPAAVDDPATVMGQTEAVDGPASDGPADDGSAGDGSAEPVIVTDDEPAVVDDPAEVADPASHQAPAEDGPVHDDDGPAGVAGPAHHQDQAVNIPARIEEPVAHGTPAGNTPAARHDSSLSSVFSGTIFPSLPKAINQTQLVDFMTMWILMQRRIDLGRTVRDTQARPVAQTPPRTPDRQPRTPVRRLRTPVRRPRGTDESRESTRSRSPIGRSSLSESAREASPVNFSAALDSEDKIKDRFITDDEDDDGSQKKVSAAQYHLFHQAVTSSKVTFKVNPAKSHRASRASLMDLGDRVSWLDQPSLVDTMASTARIAQGLKEDEDVEKTTLSEMLNTSSSTFKHLTVKQVFPREPYRLKIHRDARYVPKPLRENGFSDMKAPASYLMSQRMCLDTEGLARRSGIYASLADSMVASVIEELSPKDERTKLLREKLAIIQEAQVAAVSAGFAAASNLQLLRRDALLKNFGFQPQVLSVRTAPFEGSHVLGPEPKELQNRVRAIRQADRMAGSSVTFTQKHRETKSSAKVTSSRKIASRTSVFDRLGSLLPPRPREQ